MPRILASRPASLLAATLLVLPALAAAQPPATSAPAAAPTTADSLPPAAELVARHVAAVGGEAAVRRHHSSRMTGTLEMPGMGLRGEVTIVAVAPQGSRMRVVIHGLGEIATGYDGTTAWSMNPMQGPRLLVGAELTRLREESDFHGAILRTLDAATSRRTVARTELDGQPCYRVAVTWASGRQSAECYAVESGLLVGSWSHEVTATTTMDITTTLGDYREVGGVKFPMRMRLRVGPQEQVLTVTDVVLDDADASAVAPPAAIQALVAARGG
ncbi:MAG TPA: hypothetical protein VFS08_16140 [Gemmatimonadaceae bacterium]|nr:hypothetical protein [Gemmatimonadaceae bacterium]